MMASLRSDFSVRETSVVHGSETVNRPPPAAPTLVVLDVPAVPVTVVGSRLDPPQPAATTHTNARVLRQSARTFVTSCCIWLPGTACRSGRRIDATGAAPPTNRV